MSVALSGLRFISHCYQGLRSLRSLTPDYVVAPSGLQQLPAKPQAAHSEVVPFVHVVSFRYLIPVGRSRRAEPLACAALRTPGSSPRTRPPCCPPRTPGCASRCGPGTSGRARSPPHSRRSSISASSSARSVSTSRSLVGSSSSSRLPPLRSSFARWMRFRSPPEQLPTSFCWSGPLKLNRAHVAAAGDLLLAEHDVVGAAGDLLEDRVLVVEGVAVLIDVGRASPSAPTVSLPASGFSWPTIILNSVVLPAPFGPMTPTMPPFGRLKVMSSKSRLSP